MKKEFLTELGLTEEQIKVVQAENGKDIEGTKAKFADYEETKNALKKAQDTIAGFGDVEAIKANVEKYKTEAETARKEAETKVKQLEIAGKVKEFLNGKKFVNDVTSEYIAEKMLAELDTEAAKGKNYDDIFKALTDGKENIIVDGNKPTPPVMGQMAGNPPAGLDDALRRGAGLPPLKKEEK